MMTRIVGDAIVSTEHDDLWSVTCAEYPRGLVRVRHRRRLTQVVVADTVDPGEPEPRSFGAASCTSEGELLVTLRDAPPAIVVGGPDHRTRPATSSGYDSEFPLPGQRLILLSCAAFEAAPTLLADAVGAAGDRLATEDPQSLLLALLEPAGRGAGTVIDRRPHPGGDVP